MTVLRTFANPSEDASQNLQVAVNTVDSFHLPNEINRLCQSADDYYEHAYSAGLSLGNRGNTVKKFRLWDAQQSARRTSLTSLVLRFLQRYPLDGQASRDYGEDAGYIVE